MGRLVKTAVDATLSAGTYTYSYDSGVLPAGVYYVRLQNEMLQQVKAMIKAR
jgi:hypothetical protein